jgi:histidyl-tRNA synthetase
LAKKIAEADKQGSKYFIVIGENEAELEKFTVKNLKTKEEWSGDVVTLRESL